MKPPKKSRDAGRMVAPLFSPRPRSDGPSQDGARPHTPPPDPSAGQAATGSPATRADILDLRSFITAELDKTARSFTAELQAVGDRTARLEDRAEQVSIFCNDLASHADHLEGRVVYLEEALEDLSNRSRRNNVRLRSLPESVPPDQLEATLTGIVKRLLPGIPPERMLLDRIHRALGPRRDRDGPPRDVVARFHYYETKNSLLKAARDQEVEYEGKALSFYQDLAPSTLARRREWREITELLRNNGIRYAWGFPFKILIFLNNRTHAYSHLHQAKDLLRLVDIPIPPSVAALAPPQPLPRLDRDWITSGD